MKPLKIWFFWTPVLAQKVLLDILQDERFEVMFVVSNPDKPIWRKQILTPSPVKSLAEQKNIPTFTPLKIRWNTEFLETINAYECDYFVVVAYGKILPTEILEMPKKMCINVHGSLLPKYRWASPIQSALLYGEKITGVTIMQMDEKMDEWDMIVKQEISISTDETSATLFEKFEKISGSTLIDGIIWLESGKYSLEKQDHSQATYCSKISKEDGQVNFSESARTIYNKWQAFTPWPGIFTFYNGKRILLEKISFSSEKTFLPIGSVGVNEANKVFINTSEGVIFPEIIKMEGKKSQNITDFINGNPDFLKSTL